MLFLCSALFRNYNNNRRSILLCLSPAQIRDIHSSLVMADFEGNSFIFKSLPLNFFFVRLLFFLFQIWRVEDRDLVLWEPNLHGVFFSGDSYVIKYNYISNWRRRIIIYFWQVNNDRQLA